MAEQLRAPRLKSRPWMLAALLLTVDAACSTSAQPSSNAPTTPGAPVNVFATAGNGSVTVTWKAPARLGTSPISAYTLTADPGGVSVKATGATTATITGLTNGTPCVVIVAAINDSGAGPGTLSNIVTPGAGTTPVALPGVPVGVLAVAGDQQATVTWNPPAQTGGGALGKYAVTVSPGGQTSTVAGATTTITGLTDGTSYVFAVAASNSAGAGPAAFSNAVTPAAVPGAPAAPTDVKVSAVGDGWATVTWTAPASDGGSGILSYTVTPSAGAAVTVAGSSPFATIAGLTDGTAYTFSVLATNAAGNGPAAASASATPIGLPTAPMGVVATAGDAQATISWSAPVDTGGAALGAYTVTVTPGGTTTSVSGTTTLVTGLTDGTIYVFSVAATNTAGTGPAAPSNAVTPAPLPGAPLAPSDVLVSAVGDGWATVTWVAPESDGGSPIESYTITPSGGSPTTVPAPAGSVTISGLTDGTAYHFSVYASNAVGSGPSAGTVFTSTPHGLPSAPIGVIAVAGDGQATVDWNAPLTTGGAALGPYAVTVTPGGTTTMVSGTTTLVTGLIDGTTYVFTVAATTDYGAGTSAASNAVTPTRVPGAPSAPTNVLVPAVGDGWAAVTWSAPASNGGGPIQSFTVTPSSGPAVVVPGDATSATLTGLTDGTACIFSVFATNAAGNGPSGTSEAATPLGPPGAPLGVVAVAGDGLVTVSWDPPATNGGAALGDYSVTVTPGGAQTSVSSTQTVITGLRDGTTYVISVAATNSVGTGPSTSSNGATPTAAPVVPSAPASVSVTGVGAGWVSVAWTSPASSGTSAILSYTVTPSGGSPTTVPAAATSATLTGLTDGTPYTFSVYATNAAGNGPAATSAPATPVGLPGAPTGVLAVGSGNSATVAWIPPVSTGGSTLGSYVVSWTPGGTPMNVDGTTAVITGLSAGTAYVFTVAATNAQGTGPAASSNVLRIVPSAARSTFEALPGTALPADPVTLVLTLKDASGTALAGWPVTLTAIGTDVSLGHESGVTDPTGGYVASVSSTAAQTLQVSAATTGLTLSVPVKFSAPVACAGALTFDALPPVPSGVDPGAPTIADLNNDGRPDVVVNNDVTLTVLLGQGDGTFEPLETVQVPNGTYAQAAADFNGDGNLDLAVANANASTATVLLGNGDGTFQAPTLVAVGSEPGGVVAADFNGDGKTDLAVINYGDDTVSVLLGNGDGSFRVQLVDAVGTGPNGVATADLTGDGHLDLVVANQGDNTVSILLGNGDGTFKAQAIAAVGGGPGGLAIGDVNGDGRPDLLVPNGSASTVSVLLGNGDGTFQPQLVDTVEPGPQEVALGDFNGDGRPDMATANAGYDGEGTTVSVLLGNGDGTFQPQLIETVGSSPVGVGVADFDGDGRLDTLAANNNASSINVLLNTCPKTTAGLPGAPVGVLAVAGNQQVTVTWSPPGTTGSSAVLIYSVTVSPGDATTIVSGTSTVVSGLTNGTTYVFSVAATNAAGAGVSSQSNAATPAGAPAAPTNVLVPSVGSGSATVAWTAPASNGSPILSYTVTPSGGTGTTVSATETSATISGLTNGTAYTFNVVATNAVGTGPAGTSASATPAGLPGAPLGVVAVGGNTQATVNWVPPTNTGGSSIEGFVVTYSPGGTLSALSWWPAVITGLTNGTTYTFSVAAVTAAGTGPFATSNAVTLAPDSALSTFTATPPSTYTEDPVTLALVLLDASGTPLSGWPVTLTSTGTDVVMSHSSGTTDATGAFLSVVTSTVGQTIDVTATATGLTLRASVELRPALVCSVATTFVPVPTSPAVGASPDAVAVADFNGDGKLDIVAANEGTNGKGTTISVLLGKGDGTFQTQTIDTVGSGPFAIAVGDFNGDGRPDVVTANNQAATVSVLLGKGDGTFTTASTDAVGQGPDGVAVGDLNLDGKLDLVVANGGLSGAGTTVSVLLGNGDGTFKAQSTVTVGNSPWGVSVVDLNGDGKPDIAVVNSNSANVGFLLGNGDGTFQAQVTETVGASPSQVATADFNGDGHPDLVVSNYGGNKVSVLLGVGNGTFGGQLQTVVGSNPWGVATGDFNGDGHPDIVVSVNSGGAAVVMLGKGDGTFPTQVSQTVGSGPSAVTVGDFNGDGRLDITTANFGTGSGDTVSVLLNTCD